MTTRFDTCLQFVLAREGGFVDDPADRGGRTNKGITQTVFDEWCDLVKRPRSDVADIRDEQVAAIYHRRYWLLAKCDELPPPIDLVVFDAAVNHGPGRSIKFLQDSLGVKVDGAIGEKTLLAASDCALSGKAADLIDRCLSKRVEFYQGIIKRDPTQKKFLNGWLNRVSALEAACKVQ